MAAGAARLAVLIGTRKGLFIARSNTARDHWDLEGPHLAGYEIQAAYLDPRDPRRGLAAAHHAVWGIHLYRTENAGFDWHALREVPSHGDGDDLENLRMIWSLAPGPPSRPDAVLAGIEPAGVFMSQDYGEHWRGLDGFNAHPTRPQWSPAKGGLAVHSLQHDPFDEQRLYCALSAGGVFRSDDGGTTWRAMNRGIRAPYLPGAEPQAGHCIHRLLAHPGRSGRLYQQSHHGTYRSDDHGEHWHEVTAGLPSDFGYALATDPADAERLYTVPEQSSQLRATVGGRLRVYQSDDAGATWQARTDGLPQEHVYVTVLRDGLADDGLTPLGLYLGTGQGHLFTSRDAGASWSLTAGFLPGILSVRAADLGA